MSKDIGPSVRPLARDESAVFPLPWGCTPAVRVEVLIGLLCLSASPLRLDTYSPLLTVRAFSEFPHLLCPLRTSGLRYGTFRFHRSFEGRQPRSPGVSDAVFPYTTAGFTLPVVDGYGLRYLRLTRPALAPHYPVPVRRLVRLFHTSFRPHLTMTPLCFSSLHLHQVGRGTSTLLDSVHARHA